MPKEYEAASLHHDVEGVLLTENHHDYQSSPELFHLTISTGNMPQRTETGNMPQRTETGNKIIFLSFYIQAPLSNTVIFNLKASVGASRMVILDPIRSAFWTYSTSDIRASNTKTRRQQRTKLSSFLTMVISFRRQSASSQAIISPMSRSFIHNDSSPSLPHDLSF